jgi:hypothetical protein
VHAVQIELLEKSKRRVVATLCVAAVVLLTLSALRFVPRLNDALAGPRSDRGLRTAAWHTDADAVSGNCRTG